MKHKLKRLLSSFLAAATVFSSFAGALPQAAAFSGGDSVTLVFENDKQSYLKEKKGGTWVNLPIHECYAAENGEKFQSYCMDHGKHGIHEVSPSTNRHTYKLDAGSGYTQNPKAVGVIMRGSGRLTLQSFLNQFPAVPRDLTEDEYRYATQTAMWAALGQLSVSGTAFTSGNEVQVSSSYGTQGERVMAATRALLNYANTINHNYYVGMYLRHGASHDQTGVIDWSPSSGSQLSAENIESHGGEEYYTQEIKVASASFCQNNALNVGLTDYIPGTLLQIVKDGNHSSPADPEEYSGSPISTKPIAQTTDANANGSEYYSIVKVWVPKEAAEQENDYVFNVEASATVESFEIFVGRASGYETSADYQKYLISGPQWQDADNHMPIKWGNVDVPTPDDPSDPGDPDDPDEPEEPGELIIKKIDADTGETLADCTIEVEHIESGFKSTVTTLGDGLATIELPADKKGGWKATEITPPPGYEKDPNPVQTFSWDGKATPITLTFQNHRKPSILFVKRDAVTGETLKGAIIEVSRNNQRIGDYETQEDGTFTLTELVEGTYTFKEKQAPEGYLKTDETVTQYVNPNEMASGERIIPVEMKDYAELKLKIIKFDQQSNKRLSGITFEIFCNAVSLGRKQTDTNGEINLTGLKPGTYVVKEVATDAEHVVNSTPQQIELKVGQTEVPELVFMNQLKPGMYLVKIDSESLKPMPNVKFLISQIGGTFSKEYTTDAKGEIDLSNLEPGAYQVRELLTIDGYLIDDAVRTIQLNPDETARFVFTNTKKPWLEILKYDPDNDVYIPGATFKIAKIEDGTHYLDRVTDENGRILIENLEPGVYTVVEQAEPAHYVKNTLEYHVELFPGKGSKLVVNNYRKPNLKIVKTDAVTGKPLPGVTFTINEADSSTLTTVITGADGTATVNDLKPGVYQITEKKVPDGYLLDEKPQLITLVPNETGIVRFYNYPKPSLLIQKVDSVTGDPLKGAKFHITYASNNTSTGEINDLGDYFTDANGQIKLDKVQDGWYKVTELEAPAGYSIKQPATQEAYIKAGGSKTFTFENVPLSAIVIKKIDADSGKVLPGAWFRIRYLGGTSGTGGTTIGEYMTSSNGTIVKTGLKAGTYVIEEISAPEGYVIDNSAQTVYLSGKEQDVVTVTFGNDKKGSLLIVKKDAATGKPLSDVEFLLTDSDGSIIGNSNGKYVTDSSGTIRVDGLEPGMTVIAKETRTRSGYVLDDVPQTIKIKANETMTLEFRNQPKGSLIVVKKDSVTGKPLQGAEFKITTASGELVPDNEGLTSTNGMYKTNANGQIVLLKLTPGTYVVSETKTVDGYELDSTSQTVVVSANDAQTLTFLNTPKGKLLIEKIDSVTRSPLPGATFEIKGSSFPATSFTTNSSGQILLQDLTSGDYTIEEKRAPEGYRFESNSRVAKVEAGKTAKITIENEPLGGLLLKKMNSVTKEPLSDVIFKVTRVDGTVVGTSNGEYRTDERGFIMIPDLEPGGYVVQEVKAKPGFLLDDTPKHIEIKDHRTYSLEFFNQPKGGLVVIKKDSITGEPLKGVEFKITTSTGEVVDSNEGVTSSNGIYKTDENGVIEISKLQLGTYIITETKTLPDYVLDAAPQTVVVNANDTQTITFTNTPKGCLLVKKIDSVTHAPLSGVKFEVKGCNGCDYPAGTYTTDSNGTFKLAHIPSGCYSITETQAKDGYRLDDTAKIVKVEAGACKEITFENEPLGGLLIKKMSATTKEPISDVLFSVTHADGTSIGISNGQFRTNAEGYISIPDLQPGTYIVKEVQAKSGFLLDDTPKTVTIKDHQTYILEVMNQPKSGLLIVKKDSQTGEPLEGIEFKVTTSTGEVVDSNEGLTTSNGIYRTDSKGEIFISKLKPDTYVVSEVKTLPDYVLDASPQTVAVKPNDVQTLTFTNTEKGSLVISKVDSVTNEPISGVRFEIRGSNGNVYAVETATTDSHGLIRLDHIPSGDYVIVETQAKDGYQLDSSPRTVNVTAGKTKEVTIENAPLGGLLIKKMDSVTKEPLSEVIFKVTRTDGSVVGESNGEYRTDERGFISIPELAPGSYTVQEVQAKPGYLVDNTPKTIEIRDYKTYTLEFFNKPRGALIIVKKDAQTGEPLEGVEFKITTANGELVPNNGGMTSTNGIYRTDSNGEIVVSKLKPGAYVVTEVRTLENYVLDTTPQTVVVEENDMQLLTFTNTKKGCIVIEKVDSVTKTPLSGVKFEVRGCNGNAYPADTYTTDGNGLIQIDNIPGGDYTIIEKQAKDGYQLDSTAQIVNVEAGKTRKLTFENKPLGGLLIKKMDSVTKEPLSDVIIQVTQADGTVVGNTNSKFRTDAHGYISLPDLAPGSYIVTEVQAKPGYLLDDSPQIITIKDHQTYVLELFNRPKGNLVVVKKDSQTGEPLAGVEFKVTTASGEFVPNDEGQTSSNGIYRTDENGEFVIRKLQPGAYTVTETRTLDDYVLDAPPQTVVIEANDMQVLTFTNTKKGCLIIKKIDSVTHEPLAGVRFEIKGCNGNPYPEGSFTTDSNGMIRIDHLPSGDYAVVETKAKEGYRLDDTVHTLNIEAGKTKEVTFDNEPLGGLIVKKMDSKTKDPLSDVLFKITRSDGTVFGESNGEYRTDEQGFISSPDIQPGSYVIQEVQAKPGYLIDNTPKTIEIKNHRTYTVEFFNQPKGALAVVKKDAQTDEPLEGVEFKITTANGELVPNDEGQTSTNGIYRTNADGEIVIKQLKPGAYLVTETRTLENYILDAPPQTVVVEANDMQVLTFTNTKKGCLLIEKVDSVTKEPLSGVKFEIKGCNGNAYQGGEFTTDGNGVIQLDHLPSGDYTVVEKQAKDGYRLDSTVQTVNVEAGKTRKLTFENEPLGGLLLKKMDSKTKEPLSNVIFRIVHADGTTVGTTNSEFRTDEQGYISLPNLEPGSYIVTELRAKPGYLLDDSPKTITIKDHQTYVLEVFNAPKGGLLIVKKDSQTGEPLAGVEFKVTTANGELVAENEGMTSTNGIYVTDEVGQIEISQLKPGAYTVTETRTLDDYVLDAAPQTVVVEANDLQTLTFTNTKKGCLIIKKIDSVTREPLDGVKFKIQGCNGNPYPEGEYITDVNGVIRLDHLPDGDYTVAELQAKDGYRLDNTVKTIKMEAGKTQEITFENEPLGGLLIRKMDASTKEPISDVVFKITHTDGTVVGNSNGEYQTDAQGYISLPDLEPGSYIVSELKAKTGYLLDSTPKTIEIKDHRLYTLDFYNQPLGGLIIQKLDSVTKKPLQGVQFKITTADGTFVPANDGKTSSNDLYFTDSNGQIVLPGLAPNTYIVTEIATIDGYTIDEASRSQTVVVNTDDTQTLYFYNAPAGGLELIKVNEANQSERIPNVTFEIRKMDGGLAKTVVTDTNGRVHVPLDAGDYYAVEIKAGEGFKIDSTPHYFTVKDGETTTLTVTNKRFSGILLHKIDSVTGKGIYGVTFLLYDGNHNPIDQFVTDQDGFAYIHTLDLSGKVYLKELENQGYIVDTQTKTVYVKPGETTEIEWKNTPITGQIQITKTSEDYNTMNGWAAGTPLPNVVFEIYDRANNLVDTIKTDKNGIASSRPLPLGRYTVKETQAAEFYGLNSTPIDTEIEFAGQIVRLAMTNKAVYTNVSITKRGYAQVMPGQQIKYDISNIANNSTDSLTSFYWRDTLPTTAVRLDKIVTGTYNVQGNYKIVYKTNNSQDYRTLADNLNAMQSYVLDASPVALNLGSDECVTEFMVVFGVVPANFRMVDAAQVICNVGSWLTGGSQFVNQADCGGIHNGQWIMATDRWVTSVYKPSEPLPRTGY